MNTQVGRWVVASLAVIAGCYGTPRSSVDGGSGQSGIGGHAGGAGAGQPGAGGQGGSAQAGAGGDAGAAGATGSGGRGGAAGAGQAGGGAGQQGGNGGAGQGGGSAGNADGGPDGNGSDAAPPTAGTILWARSASTAFLLSVAEGPTGVVVTGTITAPADLGGGVIAPQSGGDAVLAQYAKSDGAHQFSSRFGNSSPAGTGSIFGSVQGFDSSGGPILSGTSDCEAGGTPACNQIDVGLGLMSGTGSGSDGFVGRYSVSTGAASWVTRLSGPGNDQFGRVVPGAPGTTYAAARYEQTATLSGGGATQSFTAAGFWDAVIGKLDTTSGAITNVLRISGPGGESVSGMAWTGSNLAIAGQFSEGFSLGSKMLNVLSGDFDDYAAMLSADLTPKWAVSFPGPGHDYGPSLATDANGDVYLAGTFSQSIVVGSKTLTGAGGTDIFVAKLRGTDGSAVWSDSIGSASDDGPNGLILSPTGDIVVVATVGGPTNASSTFFGGSDAFLVSYSGGGVRGWSKVIGSGGTDYGFSIAPGPDGFYAAVDLDGSARTTIEGIPIRGAANPVGLLLKLTF